MSERLDPRVLFQLIASHVPDDLHENILIVGSLAAAYHFRDQLEFGGVNTKDADVIVQPAGAVAECRAIATRLLNDGWRRKDNCYPRPAPEPVRDLRAIRLYPPHSDAYFIELLAFPGAEQAEKQVWIPCQLSDGWYGVPSFRFLGLTGHNQQQAETGLRYAAPAMMALANLLSHPTLGTAMMSEAIDGRILLRSAKDLGRVLALAWLSTRDEVRAWGEEWEAALRARFPTEYPALAGQVGNGLRSLLDDADALDQARHALAYGLLAGKGVTAENLKAVGAQLLVDTIEPLGQRCANKT